MAGAPPHDWPSAGCHPSTNQETSNEFSHARFRRQQICARIAAKIDAFEAEMISAINRQYPDLDVRTWNEFLVYCNIDLDEHDALCDAYLIAVEEERKHK